MPFLFPSQGILYNAFSSVSSIPQQTLETISLEQSPKPRAKLFSAWSAVDDMKSKAGSLSDDAQKEIQKASQAAQVKTGEIELYSGKVCFQK